MTHASPSLWKTVPCDADAVSALARETGLPKPLVRVLVSRGFQSSSDVDLHLHPRLSALSDPFLLPGMRDATARVWKAIDQHETIVVYGDYDVDGITSAALLIKVLARLGAVVHPFLPHRIEEGYGLSCDALKRCMESQHPHLIITVDCGTGSVEAVKLATTQGVDVIVTDHHEPSGPLAPAFALVNPKLDKAGPNNPLAGVGVAFKLCHAILKQGRADQRAIAADLDLRSYLDLVALGTITDIVPLTGENRILARHGLTQINQTDNIGLKALINVAGITGSIDAYEVGFRIGPRLNAAGRIGDALNALSLLLADQAEQAHNLAVKLDTSNRERQGIELSILEEAVKELDSLQEKKTNYGLVVARTAWHPGVIGIVASRLCSRYNRPVIVIGLDESGKGRGSGRSIDGFNMVEGLKDCADLLSKFGGHAMAAGLEIEKTNLAKFSLRFNKTAEKSLQHVDLRPTQRVDAWVDLADLDNELMDALESLRPFGFANPTPIWAARNLRIVTKPRIVGKKHLKMMLASGGVQREAIAFGMSERAIPDGPIDAAFNLKRDSYQGVEKLVMNVQDFRKSSNETS